MTNQTHSPRGGTLNVMLFTRAGEDEDSVFHQATWTGKDGKTHLSSGNLTKKVSPAAVARALSEIIMSKDISSVNISAPQLMRGLPEPYRSYQYGIYHAQLAETVKDILIELTGNSVVYEA